MSRVGTSGLSAYNKIAADDVKTAQAESFKIFVDNTEWDNFVVSFKDLPGYATYSATLMAYKTVSLPLLAGLGRICMAHQIHDGNVTHNQVLKHCLLCWGLVHASLHTAKTAD